MKQKPNKKKRRGFTLGEMVTTVAIIGSLTAVAVPNYLRIKMEVNMEMVRQELKKVQVHMNDLLNRNRQFPQNINNLGNSPEEDAITASLNTIDLKGYTTDEYQTDPLFSTYQLTTRPKRKSYGISGNKGFTVTSMGITSFEISPTPWDGAEIETVPVTFTLKGSYRGYWEFNSERYFNPSKFADYMEYTAYTLSYLLNTKSYMEYHTTYDVNNISSDTVPSALVPMSKKDAEKFKALVPKVYDTLKEKGIEIFIAERSYGEALHRDMRRRNMFSSWIGRNYSNTETIFEVGFRLKDPVNNSSEFNSRTKGMDRIILAMV
jgi:prepilin-type N-terminal cleavage/methylation domain-containing protein